MTDREKVIKGLDEVSEYFRERRENVSFASEEENQLWEFQNIAQEARSSLKAQEPSVMTKEEIIGCDGYIWFEFRGMRAMKVVLIDHGMAREPFRGDHPTKELSWRTCQETWRAWTAMPTDEQREAVKWDD